MPWPMPVWPKPTSGLSGFHVPPREAMPKAKRAAQTALSLDESLASAHAVLGFIHLVYDWDGPAAERALLRALSSIPRWQRRACTARRTSPRKPDMTRRSGRFGEPSNSIRSRYEPTRSPRAYCCLRSATTTRSNWREGAWSSNPIRRLLSRSRESHTCSWAATRKPYRM